MLLTATHGSRVPRMYPSLTFINAASSASNLTTYNFGNFTASAAGLMVVGAAGRAGSSRSISTVSIGGSAGSIVENTGSNWNVAVIATRQVSAGAQAVSVTFSAAMENAACCVWLIENCQGSPYDTADNTVAGSPLTVSVDIPIGAVTVFYGMFDIGNNNINWSSATERQDVVLDSLRKYSGADKSGPVVHLVPHSESATFSGTGTSVLAAASFR